MNACQYRLRVYCIVNSTNLLFHSIIIIIIILFQSIIIIRYHYHYFIMLFQSIIIGVVGFWGGVFVMGSVYLLMVLAKRVFKPEEADKSPA